MRLLMLALLSLLMFLSLLGSIIIPGEAIAAENADSESTISYRIGAGDVLDIRVFGESDLTGDFTISERGILELPLTGEIEVNGLDTEEGIALMCLAEALLRVPDGETADALIRDKIGEIDWSEHLG